jgi:NADH dehydrogenase [ubiquinone] 1 alpha subcomplex assembly factor 1
MFFIFLVFTLSITPSMIVFDFKSQTDIQKWSVVNDGVMGGLSKGKLTLSESGNAIFSGTVLLENNGGFSSVRHHFPNTNISSYQKIVMRVKGDGKIYQFRVKTNASDFYTYTYSFKTNGEWETIEIPFSEMTPSYRGRRVNLPNYPGVSIEEIAFLVGNGKEEIFAIEIDKIKIQ